MLKNPKWGDGPEPRPESYLLDVRIRVPKGLNVSPRDVVAIDDNRMAWMLEIVSVTPVDAKEGRQFAVDLLVARVKELEAALARSTKEWADLVVELSQLKEEARKK